MRWRSGQLALAAIVLAAVASGCKETPTQTPPDAGVPPVAGGGGGGASDGGDGINDAGPTQIAAIVDLRADVNRDGVVSMDDESDVAGKDAWDAQRGAIFLANIDDDSGRCPFNPQHSDAVLAGCHDGADAVVNGDDDLLDLAYVKTMPWAEAKDDVYAQLFVSDSALTKIRLFKRTGVGFVEYPAEEPLLAPELREGVEFAIEGKDIVRNDEVWDGFVDLRLEVNYKENDGTRKKVSDTVRMRVAPVMMFHHLEPSETVFVTDASWAGSDSTKFQSAISEAIVAAGVSKPLYRYATDDLWTQDYFETGYMSMPKAGGEQHVIRVNFRSADANRNGVTAARPLRLAGRIAFQLRGKDVAAIQEYTPGRSNSDMGTLDAFGNTETIPPYTHNGESYPLGRSIRGNVSTFYTDPNFTRMMESQKMQPPVYVDTSWLVVAHLDETISFLKVNSPRGWVVLVNDARLAVKMLEDEVAKGNGNVPMFVGKQVWNANDQLVSAERTIQQVLADTKVMNESAHAAVEVDAQLEIIKTATGITEEEIIRVPFLHDELYGASVAYQPGTVNLFAINDTAVAMPDPFGPVIDGKDIFKAQLESVLGAASYTIHWIDNWSLYHVNLGEVHCGTNAARAIPTAKWWESGR